MFRKGKKRHSSSSSQSSEISTKSKSVDSSLGGLSRSSTVASLDTDSTKSSGVKGWHRFQTVETAVLNFLSMAGVRSGLWEFLNWLDSVASDKGPLPLFYINLKKEVGISDRMIERCPES